MAKRSGLESRTAREKLPVSTKPRWVSIGPGIGLGYRRNKHQGCWVVRLSDGKGGYSSRTIGLADDVATVNGTDILSFWEASEKARQLGRGTAEEPSSIITIGEALKAYEADLRTRGADLYNASRARLHLSPTLLQRPVGLVSTSELRKWRDSLTKTLAPSSINRTISVMKAALNHAADQDERILTRRAWAVGLQALAGASRSRNVVLAPETVRKIVVEARTIGPEYGLLIEVLAVSGARQSQLYRLEVADLQGDGATARLLVPVSRKGKGAKTVKHHAVPIGAGLAARLRVAAAGRPATALLLPGPGGKPWEPSAPKRLFRRVVQAAGEDPDEVTLYALRHTSIVRQLLANVPVRVVAATHDTSVMMIERSYSQHISDFSDALVRKATLDIGDAADADVVPLRRPR